MSTQTLMNLIASLSAEEQAAVQEFIQYLKRHSPSDSHLTFREALDSFVSEHPELLERLAK